MPHQSFILRGISGVNQANAPELLSDNEVVHLQGYVLRKSSDGFHAHVRGGLSPHLPTDGGDFGAIYALGEVIDEDGVSLNLVYHTALGGVKVSVVKDDGTENSQKKTGLNSGGSLVYEPTYPGKYLVSTQVDAPFHIHGSLFADTALPFQLPKPSISSTKTSMRDDGTHAGLNPNSTYNWVFVFESDTGAMSSPSDPITHRANTSTTLTTTGGTHYAVAISGLPTTTDQRVELIHIYRNKRGSGVFYRVATEAIGTEGFLDRYPDIDLDESKYLFWPLDLKRIKYVAKHGNRMWVANVQISDQYPFKPPKLDGDTSYYPGSFDGSKEPSVAFSGTDPNFISTIVYTWRFVFISKNNKQSGYIDVTGIAETDSGTATITLPPIGLDSVDNKQAAKDLGIIGFKVYRSSSSQPTFRLLPSSIDYLEDNGVYGFVIGEDFRTELVDENSDADIAAQEAFSEPGDVWDKHRVYFSHPLKYEEITPENSFPVDVGVNGEITGIKPDGNGVIVWKEHGIYKIYTEGSSRAWRLKELIKGVGCDEPASLVKYEHHYFFFHNKTAYLFHPQGGLQRISDMVKASIGTVSAIYAATYHAGRNWYVATVNAKTPGDSSFGYVVVYDLSLKAWYMFPIGDTYAHRAVVAKNNGDLLVNYGGYINIYDETATKDTRQTTGGDVTNDILTYFRTKRYTVSDGNILMKPRSVRVSGEKHNGTIHTRLLDEDDGPIQFSSSLSFTDGYMRVNVVAAAGAYRGMSFQIFGAMKLIRSVRIDYRPLRRGRAPRV